MAAGAGTKSTGKKARKPPIAGEKEAPVDEGLGIVKKIVSEAQQSAAATLAKALPAVEEDAQAAGAAAEQAVREAVAKAEAAHRSAEESVVSALEATRAVIKLAAAKDKASD